MSDHTVSVRGLGGFSAAQPADALDESKIRFVDVGGVRTRYYEDGAGEPLVLIHGGHYGFVDALDTWSLNLKALAEHFHVFAFDKLGQGYTEPPASDAEYTYDALLAHARGWFATVGVTNAHLVGHSRGGLLAASLALDGLARSLVVVNSATLGPDPPDSALDANRFYAAVERRVLAGPPSREGLFVEPAANSFSTAHVTDAYIDRYLEIASQPSHIESDRKMRERVNAEVFLPNITQRRHEILLRLDEDGLPARTLVVWSRKDPSALFETIGLPLWNRLCERNRDVELHVFNEAGHYSYREYADEFNRLLVSFCSPTA